MKKEDIYKELAVKYSLSAYQVELICESPYHFLKEIMQNGEYKSLMLPYWGKYTVKPWRKVKLDEKISRNRRRMNKLDIPNPENREDVQNEE